MLSLFLLFVVVSLCSSQLATVFQRKAASSEAAPAEWQQEAKAKVVSRHAVLSCGC